MSRLSWWVSVSVSEQPELINPRPAADELSAGRLCLCIHSSRSSVRIGRLSLFVSEFKATEQRLDIVPAFGRSSTAEQN